MFVCGAVKDFEPHNKDFAMNHTTAMNHKTGMEEAHA